MSRSFFDVAVLPVVGNNKGQRRWVVFIVVTVCAQQFRLGQCSGFCEFGVWDSVVGRCSGFCEFGVDSVSMHW